ncbi:MAG TPA: hypothetical protein PKG95_12740, partial [Anaerolineaceae bacterium]|nr:hypothetical protein [Anaerolineaceae bacterium]
RVNASERSWGALNMGISVTLGLSGISLTATGQGPFSTWHGECCPCQKPPLPQFGKVYRPLASIQSQLKVPVPNVGGIPLLMSCWLFQFTDFSVLYDQRLPGQDVLEDDTFRPTFCAGNINMTKTTPIERSGVIFTTCWVMNDFPDVKSWFDCHCWPYPG